MFIFNATTALAKIAIIVQSFTQLLGVKAATTFSAS